MESFLAAHVEVIFHAGRYPVSPSLRCVTALTIFFFGVYLAVVCARLVRLVAKCLAGKHWSITAFEARVLEATGVALGLAPMLSVLLISARLRSIQLDPHHRGNPRWWMQHGMYASTLAFFIRIALDLLLGGAAAGREAAHGVSSVWQVLYVLASIVLYGTCVLILNFGTMAEPGPDWPVGTPAPAFSAMTRCIAALTAAYLLEQLILEVLRAAQRRPRALRLGQDAHIEAGGAAEGRPPWVAPPQHRFDEGGKLDAPTLSDLLSLHFPIMVCVLLVAIELRAVQLRLQPDPWASAAMYLTTSSVLVQAAWTIARAAARTWAASSTAEMPHQLSRLLGAAHVWPPTGGPDLADRPLDLVLGAAWCMVLGGLYIGTAVTLASVAAMEDVDFWPYDDEDDTTTALPGVAIPERKPLSIAMKSVMLLTVVYFTIYLCLIIATALRGTLRRWVDSVIGSVQRSLAFVPMLCVVMIAVRLRAMQLRVRDPQPWAQTVMYVATCAVVVQATCSLKAGSSDGDGFDAYQVNTHIAGKVFLICLLVARYIATLCLYACVAALVAALLVMEPAISA